MSTDTRTPEKPPRTDRLRRLSRAYPPLAAIEHPDWPGIIDRAQPMHLDPRTLLLTAESQCHSFVLLLEGTVRVYQLAEDGREITLYRLTPGDLCVMSLASLIHERPFRGFAQADTPIEALIVSANDFHHAMGISAVFRRWVLGSLTNSFCEMLDTFHDAVFDRLEMRLACLLGRLFEASPDGVLHLTHQQLAHELGTTREVISRSLKRFEHRGCIRLARGQIRLGPDHKLPFDIW